MRRAEMFDKDIVVVKKLGDHTVKVTMLSTCRIAGIEEPETKKPYLEEQEKGQNTEKLDNNLSRTKTRVKELVLCNSWDYWCTFTISPEKYDRYNLKAYAKDLSEFIHNYNRRTSAEDKVKYLLVPEMHEDGAWHVHGFLKGIRSKDLYVNQFGYLTWRQYENKFGFISMSKIKDADRASSYMMKYMTKDISRNVRDLGAHLYYASHGLNEPEIMYKGHAKLHCDWDYEHPDGYCKIKTFDTRKDDISEYLEVLP